MSVGILVVRLLYRFYVCVHLSKWFSFSRLSQSLMVVVSSYTLAGNVWQAGAGGILKIHLSTRTKLCSKIQMFLSGGKTKKCLRSRQ